MAGLREVGAAVPGSPKIHGDPAQRLGQVAWQAPAGVVRVAPKEHHQGEYDVPIGKKVYQGVLVLPIDRSHYPLDPVACDGLTKPPPYGEAGLNGGAGPGFVGGHHPEKQPHAPDGDGAHVIPAAVEEDPNEPAAFEAAPAREG